MKEKIVLLDMKNMTPDIIDYKEYCTRVARKKNVLGVIFSNVSKEELDLKLEKGLYDITLEKTRYMVEEKSRKITIYVSTNRKILEYYLDEYETIKIVKENEENQVVVKGDIKEIDRLIMALSRNKIKAIKIKENGNLNN